MSNEETHKDTADLRVRLTAWRIHPYSHRTVGAADYLHSLVVTAVVQILTDAQSLKTGGILRGNTTCGCTCFGA